MKKIFLIAVLTTLVICFSGCACEHEVVKSEITKVATCTEEGLKTLVCEDCGYTYTEPIAKKEHIEVSQTTKAPSCTEEGITTLTCKDCGNIRTESIPTIEHSLISKTTKQPTLTSEGTITTTCQTCGQQTSSQIDPLGTTPGNPYIVSAAVLYQDICNGKMADYENKYLEVSGKVKSISDYDDLIGYYLYGTMGKGVVCWVDGYTQVAWIGETVCFSGKAMNFGVNHVELTGCEILK